MSGCKNINYFVKNFRTNEKISVDEISYDDNKLATTELSRPMVSVIIPTLNEANNLPLVLPYLPMNWIDEVILVDGRSIDNTVGVAQQILPSIKVVMETRKGKGVAMRVGYEVALGDILIVLDADGSNDPREIPRFVTALLEGADFAKGSRFAPGGGTTDMPRYRKLGNSFFVLMSNVLFDVNFTDLCYGYHAFWRTCLDSIKLDSVRGFEIDTAMYLQAARKRLRIVEIPSFEGYRFYGTGKLKTIPDGLCVLRTILKQWLKKFVVSGKVLPVGFRGIHYERPPVFTRDRMYQETSNLFQLLPEMIQLLIDITFSGDNPKIVMKRILDITLEEVKAISGSLILLDENGMIREGCLVSEKNYQPPEISLWSDILEKGVAGWSIRNCQPALILNTKDDPRWLQREWEEFQRSALSLPLCVNDVAIGALTLLRSKENQFTYAELDALKNITMCKSSPS